MTDFIIKKLPYDLTSNAGLALAGQYLKRLKIDAALDRKFPVGVGGITTSDILKSYLGLLVQGKNDFDAIEEFRGDDFFAQALDVRVVPSCSTLRQRLDAHAASWFELAGEFNLALLWATYASAPVDFGALPCGYMAVDWDTFVMNNSGTQKEALGRTGQSGAPRFSPHRAHHRQARQPTAAGRMIKHAGRWVLGLGANDSAYTVFERLYRQLAPERKTSTA